jgi:hypothetical protein
MAMMSSLVSTRVSSSVPAFKLAVDLVATYFTEVVALIGEEQLVDDTTGGFFIRWITVPEVGGRCTVPLPFLSWKDLSASVL